MLLSEKITAFDLGIAVAASANAADFTDTVPVISTTSEYREVS